MKKNPTTLSDIANQLHISISTVSRALHDHPAISKNTKKRVIQLAKKIAISAQYAGVEFIE